MVAGLFIGWNYPIGRPSIYLHARIDHALLNMLYWISAYCGWILLNVNSRWTWNCQPDAHWSDVNWEISRNECSATITQQCALTLTYYVLKTTKICKLVNNYVYVFVSLNTLSTKRRLFYAPSRRSRLIWVIWLKHLYCLCKNRSNHTVFWVKEKFADSWKLFVSISAQ